MEQDKVAGKVLLELIDRGIVDKVDQEIGFLYLRCVYSAGLNEGLKIRSNKKPIAQFTLTGELVEIYESGAEAARRTKIDHADICNCAAERKHRNTAGGFKWKYINKSDYGENNDSSDSK